MAKNNASPRETAKPEEAAAVWVDIKALKPWDRNPRKNDKAVAKVAASMKRFGWGAPVLARLADGEIIAGHTRILAAESLGMTRVPVRYLDLDPADAHLLALADNKLNEIAEWDTAAVAAILSEYGLDDAAIAGWDSAELDKMAAEMLDTADGSGVEDVEPQVSKAEELRQKWGVERGQMWALGEHRILCGDSTKAEDVARVMGGVRATLAIHDPPYGIRVVERGLGDGRRHGNAAAPRGTFRKIEGDDRPFDPSHLLESAGTVVIWGANHFADRLPPSPAWIVWDKRDTLPSNNFSDCEMAWCSSGGSARIKRHMWNGMIRASERGDARVHPTQKPIALIADVASDMSAKGDVVTDWYHGSGTTLLACEQIGRCCRAIEIDPGYVAVAIQRWADATGGTPVLLP